MSNDVGIRLGIDGEREFRSALSGIDSQIRNLNSEMNRTVSGFSSLEDAEAGASQRMDILGRTMDATRQKIATISAQYDRAQTELARLGEELERVSNAEETDEAAITAAANAYNRQAAQVNRLGTQLNSATADLNRMEQEMRDIEDGTDRVTQSFRETGEEAEHFGSSLKDAFTGGAIAGGVQSLVSSIGNVIESTTEYRKIMGTLEVSSQRAGYTAEQTAASYQQLYGVLGDEQSSATALANLQALGLSQSELTELTDAAIGAWATYGDSIPIDGLAEAINETIQAGVVTGTFADVLNWAGTSEDEFNESLEKCKTKTERVNLVMKELSKQGLADAADAWRKNNADILEANNASAKMTETWSRMAEKLSPAVSKVKTVFAESVMSLIDFAEENKSAVTAVAATTTALVSFSAALKVTTTVQSAVTAIRGMVSAARAAEGGMTALTAAIAANPWTLAAAAIAGVVTVLGTVAVKSALAEDSTISLTKEIEEQTKAWNEMTEASKKQAEGSVAQINQAAAYVKELQGMVDANGKVKESEAERAAGLHSLVNELLPGLVTKSGEGTDATYKFADSIDELIAKQKALALYEAYKDDYTEAIKGQAEATQQLTELYAERNRLQKEYDKARKISDSDSMSYYGQQLDANQKAINSQMELNAEYQNTITQVENLNTAIQSGNYEEAASMVSAFGLSIASLGNMDLAAVTAEYDKLKSAIAGIEQQLASGDLDASQRQSLEGMLATLQGYIPEYENRMGQIAATGMRSFTSSLAQGQPEATTAAKSVGDATVTALEIAQSAMDKGKDGGQSFAAGVAGTAGESGTAGKENKDAAVSGMESTEEAGDKGRASGNAYAYALSQANSIAQTNAANLATAAIFAAQAKKSGFTNTGYNLGLGLAQGIINSTGRVVAAANSVAQAAMAKMRAAENFNEHSPSKWAEETGKFVDEGLAIGFEKGKKKVVDAAGLVATGAMKKIKELVAGGENAGLSLIQALADGIKSAKQSSVAAARTTAEKIGDAMKTQIAKLNDEVSKMEEEAAEKQAAEELATYKKNLNEKYAELKKAEKKNRKKIQDEITKLQDDWSEKQAKKAADSAKSALQEQIKSLETLKNEYEKALDEIDKKQESMANKLSDYGDLLVKTSKDGKDLFSLGDLQKDIDQITAYSEALETLKEKGTPDSLMNEIVGMSVDDAVEYTKMLLKMNDDQYDDYLALWEEKQRLASEAASKFYSDELDALNNEFVEKLPVELSSLKNDMNGVGVNAVQGMISGMNSQLPNLKNVAYSLASAAIASMRSALDIHSPSRKMAKLVGVPTGEGFVAGFKSAISDASKDIEKAMLTPVNHVDQQPIISAIEGAVNGINTAGDMRSTAGGQYVIQLVVSGKQLAEAVFDPLRGVVKQRGVSLG